MNYITAARGNMKVWWINITNYPVDVTGNNVIVGRNATSYRVKDLFSSGGYGAINAVYAGHGLTGGGEYGSVTVNYSFPMLSAGNITGTAWTYTGGIPLNNLTESVWSYSGGIPYGNLSITDGDIPPAKITGTAWTSTGGIPLTNLTESVWTYTGGINYENTTFTDQSLLTSNNPTFAGMTLSGDLSVNGGDITSSETLILNSSGVIKMYPGYWADGLGYSYLESSPVSGGFTGLRLYDDNGQYGLVRKYNKSSAGSPGALYLSSQDGDVALYSPSGRVNITGSGSSPLILHSAANMDRYMSLGLYGGDHTIKMDGGNDRINFRVKDYGAFTRISVGKTGYSQLRLFSDDSSYGYFIKYNATDSSLPNTMNIHSANNILFTPNYEDGSDGVWMDSSSGGVRFYPGTDNEGSIGTMEKAWHNMTAYEFVTKSSGKYIDDFKKVIGKTAVKSLQDIQVDEKGEWVHNTVPDYIKADSFWQKTIEDCSIEYEREYNESGSLERETPVEKCVSRDVIVNDADAKGDMEAQGYEHHLLISSSERFNQLEQAIVEMASELCEMGRTKYC